MEFEDVLSDVNQLGSDNLGVYHADCMIQLIATIRQTIGSQTFTKEPFSSEANTAKQLLYISIR